MTVKKTTRECYEVRAGHEWANITLACWDRRANVGTPHEGTYHCGEITIQSSFGCWGYVWTALGEPFKRFLQDAEFDYVFTKFMGLKLRRHDGEAMLREVRREVLSERRQREMSRSEAREAWDAVGDEADRIESSESDCGYAFMDVARVLGRDHPMHDYFADPMAWPRATKDDAQAVGFWRELWPEFVQALKAEEEAAARATGQRHEFFNGWCIKRNADGSIGLFAPDPQPGESRRTSGCVYASTDRDMHELLGKLADHAASAGAQARAA